MYHNKLQLMDSFMHCNIPFVFSKKSVVLTFFLLCWSIIAICIACYGWDVTWRSLSIPGASPPFADMRTVQGSLSSIAAGYNPQKYNPGNHLGRVMNYPKVWIKIADFFKFQNERNFILFVSGFVLAYLFSCYSLLRQFPSAYLLLAVLSSASLLAVERGNNDLLIFSLLYAALYIRADWVKSLLVLLASILKIYPIFSVFGFFNNKLRVLGITVTLAVAYWLVNYNEIHLIRSGYTAEGPVSYGIHLNEISALGLLPIFALSYWFLKNHTALLVNECSPSEKNMFMVGGSIFVLTFIFAKNWDYRLIFLLLCLPFIQSFKNKIILHSTSVCTLLSMNVLMLGLRSAISTLCKVYLFLAILTMLMHVLSSTKLFSKIK